MKNKLYPGIAFLILFLICGMFAGAMIGSLLIPKNSGLAGPTILIGYSLLAGGLSLIFAAIFVWKSKTRLIVQANFFLLIISIAIVAWMIFSYQNNRSPESNYLPSRMDNTHRMTVKPVNFNNSGISGQEEKNPVAGLGIARILPEDQKVLYFYGRVRTKSGYAFTISDSLVFAQSEHYVDVVYAPPWLFPEHIKLDYQVFNFRVISRTRNELEVVANKSTGLKYWLKAESCHFEYWPDFMISCSSIEALDEINNPLRIKPLENAGLHHVEDYAFLKAIAVSGDFVEVEVLDNNLQFLTTGWLRWREDDSLLISYSLFM